jgi:hypothetical protein
LRLLTGMYAVTDLHTHLQSHIHTHTHTNTHTTGAPARPFHRSMDATTNICICVCVCIYIYIYIYTCTSSVTYTYTQQAHIRLRASHAPTGLQLYTQTRTHTHTHTHNRRPSASELLNHPFVASLGDPETPLAVSMSMGMIPKIAVVWPGDVQNADNHKAADGFQPANMGLGMVRFWTFLDAVLVLVMTFLLCV